MKALFTLFSLAFVLVGFFLIIFACSHYDNHWCYLLIPLGILAFVIPQVCWNYNRGPSAFLNVHNIDAERWDRSREMGWSAAALVYLCMYALPIVVWYNSSLPWQGVLFMNGALVLWGWAFAAFLKAFVFY